MPFAPGESRASASVIERVQAILGSKKLTLYQVSQQSAALYGRSSPFFIPHNLYYDLRSAIFSPSVFQMFTLSRISGYRFRDWLGVFGFDLEDIPRLQVLLPSRRTILLDTSLTDPKTRVTWFRNRASREPIRSIAPLVQLLEFTSPRPISSLPSGNQRFLYAKIGREDALAFPDIAPGSIVRVSPHISANLPPAANSRISDRSFLIEHSKGFCCCRIRFLANGVIVPFGNGFSHAQVELRVPQEARIRGAVDLEFRSLLRTEEPRVPRDLARHWKPQSLPERQSFGQLLKQGRSRVNMSTRQAAEASCTIAELLKDDRYQVSSSSLSDYELRNTPPRDFHKIITLCSIYGLEFESATRTFGIEIDESGREPIPDRYAFHDSAGSLGNRTEGNNPGGFLATLMNGCQNEVPFFLRDLMEYFSGPGHASMDDLFWIGGNKDPHHPYLSHGLLALVNRRRKTPLHFASKPLWQQPIYLLLARESKYLAACCGIEDDKLVIHPYGADFHPSAEFRHHQDVEVVGQIMAIARRIA